MTDKVSKLDPRKKAFIDDFFGENKSGHDFEEKKFKYMIENLDYNCELDWNRGEE